MIFHFKWENIKKGVSHSILGQSFFYFTNYTIDKYIGLPVCTYISVGGSFQRETYRNK